MVCRWLAYQGKSIYLDELLYQPDNSLIVPNMDASKAVTPVNGDGFGAAWYEGKRQRLVYIMKFFLLGLMKIYIPCPNIFTLTVSWRMSGRRRGEYFSFKLSSFST